MRDSDFVGGKRVHTVEAWPQPEFFDGKRKSRLINYRLSRLDWGLGDNFIESIRFTMSNGDISPKFGRKAISHWCAFESTIKRVTMTSRGGCLVGLVFDTEADGEFLRIEAG